MKSKIALAGSGAASTGETPEMMRFTTYGDAYSAERCAKDAERTPPQTDFVDNGDGTFSPSAEGGQPPLTQGGNNNAAATRQTRVNRYGEKGVPPKTLNKLQNQKQPTK